MAGERQTDVEKNVYFVFKSNTVKNIFLAFKKVV